MKRVFRAKDVPDAHKIAVYDALCLHFSEALDHYYTDAVPTDPRYDSGGAESEEGCMIEGSWANVVMAIPGWADAVGFSVELPALTRQDQTDEGSWIEVAEEDDLISTARTTALKEAAAICRRRAGPFGGVGLLLMLIEAAEEIEGLVPSAAPIPLGSLCARCGQPCDNLQGQYIVANIIGDICHRCISEEDVIVAVAK